MNSPRVLANKQPWSNWIDLLVIHDNAVAREIVFETVEPFTFPQSPTLKVSGTAAQDLMDQLWMCGIRPTEAAGSAGALAAVNRHLEDMRTLVFKKSPDGQ